MARKPDELTLASLQIYLEDLQFEYNELEEKQEGEEGDLNRDEYEEKMEVLQTRIDSVEVAIEALNDVH